ncbi:hypothetical protein NP493_65g06036 [Ridgeia piscesae]|uniref:SAM domain-containing protein n=1 Tax=Ridgeia piscesae TaxID=27915 RepID=A0AAD9P9Z6_RIDPI|nr:hypothetical protein NP493_65g06036 [Ridgeia piscesae]
MQGQTTERGHGHTAVQGQATEQGHGHTGVQRQEAASSVHANPPHQGHPESQAGFAPTGNEVVRRRSTKRLTRYTDLMPPISPGQTAVQGQQGTYHTPNQPAPLIPANPSYQASPAPPSSQAVFAAAGTEAARQATKRLSRQTPPTSPALVGHPTLNHPQSHTDVKDMSVDEITDWMRRMKMGQYTDVIVTNGVDGTLLKSLDEDILTRELGFTRFYAIKLLKFANEGYRPT